MKQTLSGYIRQHLAEIEQRLEFGTRQEVIVSELVALGYPTTIQSFRNMLCRARERAKTKQPETKIQEVKKAVKPDQNTQKEKQDPLTKSAGFEFKGTNSFNENDLI